MFLFHLKFALRNLFKNRSYSIINTVGLAFGMACSILLLLWANFEKNYDNFHEKKNQLYQVYCADVEDNSLEGTINLPGLLIENLKEKFPEIVRGTNHSNWTTTHSIKIGNESFTESFNFADPDFFQMFSFPLLKGNKETVFKDPYSLVISEKAANKYFAGKNPIGKIVQLNNEHNFTITGVMANQPQNSIFQFDFLYPYEYMKKIRGGLNSWYTYTFMGFVELAPNCNVEELNKKLASFYDDFVEKESGSIVGVYPLTKARLEIYENSGKLVKTIKLFTPIGILILLIACFNYINIITACSLQRAKEIATKKVIGATQGNIIKQVIIESVLQTFIAANFAVILIRVLLPIFNKSLNKNLQFDYTDPSFIWLTGIIIISTILISGIYPALILSKTNTIKTIKGEFSKGKRGAFIRKSLLVLQFTITLVLLSYTFVVGLQMNYVLNKPTGINRSNVISCFLYRASEQEKQNIKELVCKNTAIECASYGSANAIQMGSMSTGFSWGQDTSFVNQYVYRYYTDSDFMNVFDVKMKEGSYFNSTHFYPKSNQIIVNETFAKIISNQSVVNTEIKYGKKILEIVGVMKDFNNGPLSEKIPPLVIYPREKQSFLMVRFSPQLGSQALQVIQENCKEQMGDKYYSINFLEDQYSKMYQDEKNILYGLLFFTSISILITLLGIIGLSLFIAEDKTKEIGIRKVLGATVFQIRSILTRVFSFSILIACLISLPISWYYASDFLGQYAYKINFPIWALLISPMIIYLISLITIYIQTWKVSRLNPTENLRYE